MINKEHRSFFNDAEDLAYPPSYSPWTKWFTGSFVAGLLAIYAGYAWFRGSVILLGRNGSIEITGDDAPVLATAYLALAAFIHFHCFWNLQEGLDRYAQPLKVVALLIFLLCLCTVILHQLGFYFS